MSTGVCLTDVLTAREARAARQAALIEATGCPVVSVTVVSPGPVKSSPQIERLFAAAATAMSVICARRGWPVVERTEVHAETGPELQLAVLAEARELKQAAAELEDDHAWGRLWDIDVVVADGPLSRTAVGAKPRRCLLCAEDAAGCARSRRHDPAELARAASDILASPVGDDGRGELPEGPRRAWAIGALAGEALRTEARLAPKPGLVDVHDRGAHTDMGLANLLASADAIEPWFVRMAELGAQPCWSVAQLKELGLAAERAMLSATAGINTHKGAIYLLGWLCAVAGGAPSVEEVAAIDQPGRGWSRRISFLATPLLDEWLLSIGPNVSEDAGCRSRDWMARLGLSGARGEAASGLKSVFGVAVPRYRRARGEHWAPDDALLITLLSLLAEVEDTNVVARGGLSALRQLQAWARDTLPTVSDPQSLRRVLTRANRWLSAEHWSPGGSADLVAATWLVDQLDALDPAGRRSAADVERFDLTQAVDLNPV